MRLRHKTFASKSEALIFSDMLEARRGDQGVYRGIVLVRTPFSDTNDRSWMNEKGWRWPGRIPHRYLVRWKETTRTNGQRAFESLELAVTFYRLMVATRGKNGEIRLSPHIYYRVT